MDQIFNESELKEMNALAKDVTTTNHLTTSVYKMKLSSWEVKTKEEKRYLIAHIDSGFLKKVFKHCIYFGWKR